MASRPRYGQPPEAPSPYPSNYSYITAMRGKSFVHPPMQFRFPSLWAFLAAGTLQFVFGLSATGLSFLLLVIADVRRCPVALGASPMRPFVAWLVGVCLSCYVCEHMDPDRVRRNPNASWVFWGAFGAFYRWLFGLP